MGATARKSFSKASMVHSGAWVRYGRAAHLRACRRCCPRSPARPAACASRPPRRPCAARARPQSSRRRCRSPSCFPAPMVAKSGRHLGFLQQSTNPSRRQPHPIGFSSKPHIAAPTQAATPAAWRPQRQQPRRRVGSPQAPAPAPAAPSSQLRRKRELSQCQSSTAPAVPASTPPAGHMPAHTCNIIAMWKLPKAGVGCSSYKAQARLRRRCCACC
jgi:hypothetical protein